MSGKNEQDISHSRSIAKCSNVNTDKYAEAQYQKNVSFRVKSKKKLYNTVTVTATANASMKLERAIGAAQTHKKSMKDVQANIFNEYHLIILI